MRRTSDRPEFVGFFFSGGVCFVGNLCLVKIVYNTYSSLLFTLADYHLTTYFTSGSVVKCGFIVTTDDKEYIARFLFSH